MAKLSVFLQSKTRSNSRVQEKDLKTEVTHYISNNRLNFNT